MKITFSSTHNAFSVKAPKGTLISLTGEPTVIKDGVYVVGDDGSYTIDDGILTDSIYLSTEGGDYTAERGARVCYPAEGIEVRAGSSVLPFKVNAKGGGGSGYTLTQLYQTTAASAADIPLADIELSHPYTDYDVLVFLIVTRNATSLSYIRAQQSYDVKSLEGKTGAFLLGDFGATNQFIEYDYDPETPTLLKYTYQLGNFHLVYAVYGVKYSGNGGGGDSGNTHYKGTTTTALENGSTTNPITINGESYTAVFGDVVVYSYTEFVFDGTQWSEFGRPFDTEPTAGSTSAVTSDGVYRNTAGRKYYVGNDVRGEIFNDYENNVAIANYSHAEGTNTRAAGSSSHAEGDSTRASGGNSHAEGNHTEAIGGNSHAGGYYTIANKFNSTVIGKYNVADTNVSHLLIVGNGISANNRSNIFEVSETDANVNGEMQINGIALPTPYTTMPAVTESMVGKFALYLGTTTTDYVKGKLYEAVSDGSSYSWEAIN